MIICNLCIGYCNLPAFAEDKIIAVVNSDIITKKDLDDFLNFMRLQLSGELKGEQLESKIQSMKLDLLARLIEDRLILQEAKKNGITVDEGRVRARIDDMRRRYNSDAGFQKSLARQGLTLADVESKVREQLLMYNVVDLMVRSKIVISPTEVTEFYENNRDKIKIPEQRQVLSITIGRDKSLADDIFIRLQKGKSLQEIIEKYSFANNEITVMQNGELRQDIEETIFDLKPEQVSRPIQINGVFYLFKLKNIITPKEQSLSEAQEGIHTYLFEEKMQKSLNAWLQGMKKQAHIQISQ